MKVVSFASLPPELVDLIAEYVGAVEGDGPLDRKSLCAFCLVGRQTLPAGQRALYASPLYFGRLYLGETLDRKHDLLLTTLRSNGRYLGRLVRSTEGAERWRHSASVDIFGNDVELFRWDWEEWYLNILQACPELREADLFFSSDRMIRLSLAAVAYTHTKFTHVRFHGPTRRELIPGKGFPPTMTTAFKAIRSRFARHLAEVSFYAADWIQDHRDRITELPRDVTARTINIRTGRLREGSLLSFLPCAAASKASPPRTLNIDFEDKTTSDQTKLSSIGERVGSTLKHLSLDTWYDPPETLYDYVHNVPSPILLPVDALVHFTSLRTISIHCHSAPFLSILRTLSSLSPHITSINLRNSCWTQRERLPFDIVAMTDESLKLFPVVEVHKVIVLFKKLEHVHFGILPNWDEGRYERLKHNLESEFRIKVEYQICGAESLDSEVDEENEEDNPYEIQGSSGTEDSEEWNSENDESEGAWN